MEVVEGLTTLPFAGVAMPIPPAPRTEEVPLWEVLGAPGPEPGRAEKMGLYEPLLGSWEVEVVDHLDNGEKRVQQGEWHFAWVLEGRAIQDVLIVPARSGRNPGEAPGDGNRFGTSIRVYDPRQDAWSVTWLNPVTGKTNRLVGRQAGYGIAQIGMEEDGSLIRWSFREIALRSFRWLGEVSRDGGRTWKLVVEFFARRSE